MSQKISSREICHEVLGRLVSVSSSPDVVQKVEILSTGTAVTFSLDEDIAEKVGTKEFVFLVLKCFWRDNALQLSVAKDGQIFDRIQEEDIFTWLNQFEESLHSLLNETYYDSQEISSDYNNDYYEEDEITPDYLIEETEDEKETFNEIDEAEQVSVELVENNVNIVNNENEIEELDEDEKEILGINHEEDDEILYGEMVVDPEELEDNEEDTTEAIDNDTSEDEENLDLVDEYENSDEKDSDEEEREYSEWQVPLDPSFYEEDNKKE